MLAFAVPKNAMPPNFVEKTFANSHKIMKFAKVFSRKSFTLYGIRATLKSRLRSDIISAVTVSKLKSLECLTRNLCNVAF